MNHLSRRSLLAGATIVGLSGTEVLAFAENEKPFKFMMNTSPTAGRNFLLKIRSRLLPRQVTMQSNPGLAISTNSSKMVETSRIWASELKIAA